MAQLTTGQILLLNNLMYMTDIGQYESRPSFWEGKTFSVEQIINSIDSNKLDTSFTTKEEWQNIIDAIRADDILMNMNLVSAHVDQADGGGGGTSALFVDSSTNEAVVVFKGTAQQEWKDNFTAGADASSVQQENALEWYRSLNLDSYATITVTGHSKGGNKAKYITVMDNSVDRCLSFDGQGFSDVFIEKYANQIYRNQDKIENHIVDYDYVNFLLNDIGSQIFYEGQNIGNFLENHCPNSFFDFNEDGSYTFHETERPAEMTALDHFLNSYLRSLQENEKKEMLSILGDLAQTLNTGGTTEDILILITSGDNEDKFAYLIAYLIEYEQKYPEFSGQIENVLNRFDMREVTNIVNIVTDIMDKWWFDLVLAGFGIILEHLPDFLIDELSELIEGKLSISLTSEQLEQLLGMVRTVSETMDEIEVHEDGSDKQVEPSSLIGEIEIIVNFIQMYQIRETLEQVCEKLNEYAERFQQISRLQRSESIWGIIIKFQGMRLENHSSKCRTLSDMLENAVAQYQATEKNCTYIEG